MKLDLNRAVLSVKPLNQLINELIEAAAPPTPNTRQYLGASDIGSDCLRKIQFNWLCDPQFPARTLAIFARGHFFEGVSRNQLIAAGFKFASKVRLGFKAVGGLFRGHADGILVAGPQVDGLIYPAIWEHKALGAKGWRAVERDGLTGLYKVYAAQVALYQAYLDVTTPALFSVLNADTCERLNFAVPFDAQLAQEISDRAVMVIQATQAGEQLPRVTENPEDWRCKMCQWRKSHCWKE